MGEMERLPEEEVAQQGAIEGQGVVEDHRSAGSKAFDARVPCKEADDAREDADVEEGQNKTGAEGEA
jgi:hypothetical protein